MSLFLGAVDARYFPQYCAAIKCHGVPQCKSQAKNGPRARQPPDCNAQIPDLWIFWFDSNPPPEARFSHKAQDSHFHVIELSCRPFLLFKSTISWRYRFKSKTHWHNQILLTLLNTRIDRLVGAASHCVVARNTTCGSCKTTHICLWRARCGCIGVSAADRWKNIWPPYPFDQQRNRTHKNTFWRVCARVAQAVIQSKCRPETQYLGWIIGWIKISRNPLTYW